MKYIIDNKDSLKIIIVAVVIVIFDALKAFGTDIAIDNTTVYFVVSCVWAGVLGYFNIPTSYENSQSTGEMRQKKAEKKKDYKGDKFYNYEELM